jgi:NTP pyrophosphatase (non-canonical NTP hydrolase)
MDKRKWEYRSHPISVWISKLMEEVGEVAKEFSEPDVPDTSRRKMKNAVEELKHVEFIARNFRRDLEERIAGNA